MIITTIGKIYLFFLFLLLIRLGLNIKIDAKIIKYKIIALLIGCSKLINVNIYYMKIFLYTIIIYVLYSIIYYYTYYYL